MNNVLQALYHSVRAQVNPEPGPEFRKFGCYLHRERNTGAVNEALRAAVLLAVSFCIAVELLFHSIDEETLELFISSMWGRL